MSRLLVLLCVCAVALFGVSNAISQGKQSSHLLRAKFALMASTAPSLDSAADRFVGLDASAVQPGQKEPGEKDVHELLKSDDDKLKKLSYLSYCERAYGAGLSWSKTKKTGYNQIPENDSKCVLLMTIKEIDRIYTYLPEDVKGVVNKLKEELKKLLLEGKHNGVKEQFQETFTNTLPKNIS